MKNLLLTFFAVVATLCLQSQVTQINSNRSLEFNSLLSNSKAIYVSDTDSTIWVTDGSSGGTTQLSANIKLTGNLGSLNYLDGKLIFAGTTPAMGTEVYITDGTPGGTILVKDINPGAAGSSPDHDVALLNGFIYFTAERPAEGRELWRTDGTPAGTTLVKDIVPGAGGSNTPGNYHLFSSGTYLLFAARTPASGIELWKSDGTDVGTVLFKDINTGHAGADSSNPRFFYLLNNIVLFAAKDATHGDEIWRTDGTPGGTTLLMDINPGAASSTSIEIIPGFGFPVFLSFHTFNNHAFFIAYDGTSTGEVWSTDGSSVNTSLVKDIVPGASISFILLTDAINLANKFIFPVADQAGRSELWESDGTPGGTKLFKTFSPINPNSIPFIFAPFAFTNGSFTQPLFQGNKFFFSAGTATEGSELWITDGVDSTVTHTHIVKDINPGPNDGFDIAYSSWIYTSSLFYFPAGNGTNGIELWKTDGTSPGTLMVADIITGIDSSKPHVDFYIVNGKILFEADNGDSPTERDLYAVDGNFTPLPISLADFTVVPKSDDAILNWRTLQELNSKDFTIQRSFDGLDFKNIGTVGASGTSTTGHAYSFIDAGIINSGKGTVYFRLLSADIDGKSALSQVITLKLKSTGKWNIRLLNNPVSENIKVLLSGITQNVQLTIIDISGKKLYTNSLAAINGQISIPAALLQHGRYVLLTETGNERKTIQFVK